MAADPLEEVLELVEQGRLTADEAAPILAALDETVRPAGRGGSARPKESPEAFGTGFGSGFRAGFGAGPGDGTGEPATEPPGFGPASGSLRIEVREGGRQVVNLRLPMAVGRLALDRVPGLSGDQVDRVREALRTGMRGPVLEVEDGDNAVRIVLE
jgi:hypothetical protein